MTRSKTTKTPPPSRPLYNTAVLERFVDECGSQKLAAYRIGVDQGTLIRARRGLNISMVTFWRIVDAIGISGPKFLCGP